MVIVFGNVIKRKRLEIPAQFCQTTFKPTVGSVKDNSFDCITAAKVEGIAADLLTAGHQNENDCGYKKGQIQAETATIHAERLLKQKRRFRVSLLSACPLWLRSSQSSSCTNQVSSSWRVTFRSLTK